MNSKEIRNKMYKFFYSEKFIATVMSIFFIINLSYIVTGQSTDNLPCYSIAQENGEPVVLYELNPTNLEWRSIGNTQRFNIRSIAIDAENSTIFAVDSGTLGTLNPVSAEFEAIGKVGTGFGDFGFIEFNNIRGLAYDPVFKVLFATHNIPGFANNSNDLLLKINPSTGSIIRHTMMDSLGARLVDYARIEKTNSWTIGALPIRDINDIAFHPFSGQLYAFHKQGKPAVLSILNINDGNIEQVINDVSELDVGGLGFDLAGDLYGTSMADFLNNKLSKFHKFDVFVGTSESLGTIDESVSERTSFICFDCFKKAINLNPCSDEEINITNYVYGGPDYSSKGNINANATIEFPTIYKAAEEIRLFSNFQILISPPDPEESIDTLVIFSAVIENCQ